MDLDVADPSFVIPSRDTRELLSSCENYLPVFSDLVKVIPNSADVDSLLTRAIDGPVRYSGVRAETETAKSTGGLLGMFQKRAEAPKVERQDVEGILWYRNFNEGQDRGKFLKLEFDGRYHDQLDQLVINPSFTALLEHPEVQDTPRFKTFLEVAEAVEIHSLVGLMLHPDRVGWDKQSADDLGSSILDCRDLGYNMGVGLHDALGSKTFLIKTDADPREWGSVLKIHTVSEVPLLQSLGPTYTQSLEQVMEGATRLLTEAEATKDTYTPYVSAVSFLTEVIEKGQGIKDHRYYLLLPGGEVSGEDSKLVTLDLPSTYSATDIDRLLEQSDKVRKCLSQPEFAGFENSALSALIGTKQPALIAEGISFVLSLPPNERRVVDSTYVPNRSSPAAHRFSSVFELVNNVHFLCKNNPNALGVLLVKSNRPEKRKYLRWSEANGFQVAGCWAPAVTLPATTREIFNNYRRSLGTNLDFPEFLQNSRLEEVDAMFRLLGRSGASAVKYAQICRLNPSVRTLLVTARQPADRVYARRDPVAGIILEYGNGVPLIPPDSTQRLEPATQVMAWSGAIDTSPPEGPQGPVIPDLQTSAGNDLTNFLKQGKTLEEAFELIRSAYPHL